MTPHIRRAALLVLLAVSAGRPATAGDIAHWQLDMAKSRLGFAATQSGMTFQGRFQEFTATIAFDPANLEGSSIAVDVDMTSVTTGNIQRDTALPDKDWFNVASFPNASFRSSTIHKVGNGYEAVGSLIMRGVGQPLILPFSLIIDGDTAHAKGQVSINRTLFGVGQGAWSTGDIVGTMITIDLDITARRPS